MYRPVFLLVLVSSLVLSACSANYFKNLSRQALQEIHLADVYLVERHSVFVLHRSSKIYLTPLSYSELSIDFSTPSPAYPRKQFLLEQALEQKLQQSFPHTISGDPGVNRADSFLQAAALGREFLIYPVFNNYENRLNQLSELVEGRDFHENKAFGLDESVFTLSIYDVYSQTLLDTVEVRTTARLLSSEKDFPERIKYAANLVVSEISNM